MTDWVRRGYDGVGLTQSPPGRHLAALQEPYLGKVFLCIDVSSSMGSMEAGRTRLAHAVAGAERFVEDAFANHYRVGLILWNDGIQASIPLQDSAKPVVAALHRAHANGGTNVVPGLTLGIGQLGGLRGDRVLAVFGDGDLGNVNGAVAESRRAAALGIRIIVRGLGEYAAAQLNLIATEPEEAAGDAVVADAAGIENAIASMADGIRSGGLRRR